MSRKQGPREAGMRPAANAGSDRREPVGFFGLAKEEAV